MNAATFEYLGGYAPLHAGYLLAQLTARLVDVTARAEITGATRRCAPATVLALVVEPLPGFAARLEQLRVEGLLEPRLSVDERAHWGRRSIYALLRLHGERAPLNLYAVMPPVEWGTAMILHTGPVEFVRLLLRPYGADGGMLPGYRMQGGVLLDAQGREVAAPDDPGKSPEGDEAAFFAALRLREIAPWARSEPALRTAIRARETALTFERSQPR